MSMQFFAGRGKNGERILLPLEYRKTVKWLPQIGDIFPNFDATTTAGPLRFVDWAKGHWCFLFSHPAAFTPVCETEMVALSRAKTEFDRRDVRLLSFTQSSLEEQKCWHEEIFKLFGTTIDFPTVDDQNQALARAFGMIHEKESASCSIRKSFILDPQMKIRMIFEYPIYIGRSTTEVLRTIDALQAVDEFGVATPADWQQGNAYLCSETHKRNDQLCRFDLRWPGPMTTPVQGRTKTGCLGSRTVRRSPA